MANLSLSVLPYRLAVCQIEGDEKIPEWVFDQPFWSITRTSEELSIVLPEGEAPPEWKAERGWRAIMVPGPLDFSQVGVLANLAVPLADVQISIFALSTYNTDYILVQERFLELAKRTLMDSGYVVAQGL